MNDADLEALPLFERAQGIISPGYHFRPEGRTCPRGHRAPVRDSDGYCAECRRLEARSWGITRRTGHAIATGRPIPSLCVFVIGASPEEVRAFLLEGCQRGGFAPEDYGRTWGIYHVQPIHVFDLKTTAGLRAANRLENLRVDRLHNTPRK
jgi:hypothetical protein